MWQEDQYSRWLSHKVSKLSLPATWKDSQGYWLGAISCPHWLHRGTSFTFSNTWGQKVNVSWGSSWVVAENLLQIWKPAHTNCHHILFWSSSWACSYLKERILILPLHWKVCFNWGLFKSTTTVLCTWLFQNISMLLPTCKDSAGGHVQCDFSYIQINFSNSLPKCLKFSHWLSELKLILFWFSSF